MHTCERTHTHTHKQTHTDTHRHTDAHTDTHTHTDAQTHTHTQRHRHTDANTHRRKHTQTQTHTHTHTDMHACMHACIHTHEQTSWTSPSFKNQTTFLWFAERSASGTVLFPKHVAGGATAPQVAAETETSNMLKGWVAFFTSSSAKKILTGIARSVQPWLFFETQKLPRFVGQWSSSPNANNLILLACRMLHSFGL